MGADLYESYCGSILATMALGAAAFSGVGVDAQMKAILAPMTIAAIGVALSIIGIYVVRTKEGAGMDELLKSLGRGTNLSSVLIAVATFGIMYLLGMDNWWQLSLSVVTGLVAGVIIGQATEYYTSQSYKPTQKVSESGVTGPATVIISGMGLGMLSTAIPVVAVVVGILLSYMLATGFSMNPEDITIGLYGIAIASVGMLSTLGITLATDAYGPVADNAGGIAQMAGLDEKVRERTDALDSLGNTTAATGKGFAIGCAALTALALMASYIDKINTIDGGAEAISNLSITNPSVLVGLFIGACLPFVFAALTMNSVGRAAQSVVVEVRRQFKEIKGLMQGEAEADYASCVDLCTKASLREMVLPTIVAVIVPIAVGLILGCTGVVGMLAGATASGFLIAIFMSNSGGAWDNAKKYIESGVHGGKGSENHKAAVVGDTVGDPFKDTSGPAINILIKLLSMVSIVFATVVVNFSLL
jgi:K(+)-stimulated pyrophosphate-energized sodium pump